MSEAQDEYNIQRQRDTEVISKALAALSEHFDSVQIFVNRYNPAGDLLAGNFAHDAGSGDFFCRYAQVKLWMQGMDALTNTMFVQTRHPAAQQPPNQEGL
jgi:hypothetical protein